MRLWLQPALARENVCICKGGRTGGGAAVGARVEAVPGGQDLLQQRHPRLAALQLRARRAQHRQLPAHLREHDTRTSASTVAAVQQGAVP